MRDQEQPENSGNKASSQNPREQIKHYLVGSRKAVESTISALHISGYAEVREWSRVQPGGNLGKPGEVISILIRYLVPEKPTG
jgi:hypothetical protein